ncbi:MAG: hypothetical protein RLN82_01665 [Pseudomonadales bacterium]
MNNDLTQSIPAKHTTRRILLYSLPVVALLALGAASVWFFTCPCERMPGAYLSGDRVEQPIADWTFANQVQLCQIQTSSGFIPHAINLNCMADSNGKLFLSCSQCEGKRWSTAALENPAGYIRLEGQVYPITLRRLVSSSELDNAWRSRAQKLSRLSGATLGEIPNRPDHWWSFQVSSRS